MAAALFVAPSLAYSPATLRRPRWTCAVSRVLLVPDHLTPSRPPWYAWLSSALPLPLSIASVPNPYLSNSKRWERVWLSALRDAVQAEDLLLGHGSGADVVLRFLEEGKAEAVVLVLPSGDEYFAGERHGRRYHWEQIKRNVGEGGIGVVTSSATAEPEESDNLVQNLEAEALRVDRERGRLACEEKVIEVLELLLQVT